MGLNNIREKSGSIGNAIVGGLSALEFISELISTDKEPIDITSPIELGTYKLVTEVGRGNIEKDFTLPKESYERVERFLKELRISGIRKAVRKCNFYAHEYLGNEQFVSFLASYMSGATREQEKTFMYDDHAFKRDRVQKELSRTLAHLRAAHLHLYHRPEQRKENPELENLCQKIDKELIPHFRNEKHEQQQYWLL